MKCPNCHDRKHIGIKIGDGFTETDTRECSNCGAIWYYSETAGHIINIIEGNPDQKTVI